VNCFYNLVPSSISPATPSDPGLSYGESPPFGAVHKVRQAQGEGVREGVTICDRGRGAKSMWRHFKKNSYIWNLKLKVMFSFLLSWMYSDRRGTDKNHPRQYLPDKKPQTKPPGQKPSCIKTYVCMYAMHVLLKIWGVRELWRTLGLCPEMWQSLTWGRESKLVQIAWRTLWTVPRLPTNVDHY